MKALDMWQEYQQINPNIGDEVDAWAFGAQADLLAQLVLEGTKTATASAYDLYQGEPLPEVGSYDVILDGQKEAICIIQITKVSIVPFAEVSASHAFKEGEGNRSLSYWRQVHKSLFSDWFEEAGLTFTEKSPVVYPVAQKADLT